jgi:signal transduction histidine kinase
MSEAELLETERAARLTEGVFERYFYLAAWRARAFADARHSLSGDLHDSVLQTLAALRLQIASLINDAETRPEAERTAQLETLQSVIVEEQTRLRHILDESYRTSEQSVDLIAQLTECTAYLSRQWGIRCRLLSDEAEIRVDSNTAVEVEFLAREAAANAVQHADARALTFVTAIDENTLMLTLRSETSHRTAPSNDAEVESRSLSRRLNALGGVAYSEDVHSGSLLAIRIPIKKGQ